VATRTKRISIALRARVSINFRILGALEEFIQFIGRDAWTGVYMENVKWNCALQ
jgi:hypothetical protein